MNEDVSQQLGEIAALLRRRVEIAERSQQFQEERQRESATKSSEMLERFQSRIPKIEMPKFELPNQEEHREQMRRIQERSEESRAELAQFHERLLAALERQNSLLERIASRLEK